VRENTQVHRGAGPVAAVLKQTGHLILVIDKNLSSVLRLVDHIVVLGR
jgi:ABC-type branched-subunit amino acid transport system ATPase component